MFASLSAFPLGPVVIISLFCSSSASDFSCNETSSECVCHSQSCSHICTPNEPCSDYGFHCTGDTGNASTCDILCYGSPSCHRTKVFMATESASVRCVGEAACNDTLVQCAPKGP